MCVRTFTIYLSLFAIILSFKATAQGAISGFYNTKGSATLVMGVGFEDPKHYYIGREKANFGRNLYSISLFGIYGISNRFNVQAVVPYLASDDQRGLQDLQVFAKYQAYEKQWETDKLALSLAAGFSTNISNYNVGGLNDIGQRATIFETRFLLHYQQQSGWFANIQSGFSYKLEEVPNSFPFTFKFGKGTNNGYFDFWYDFQYAFGGIDYRGTPAPQNFREIGVSFHKVGGTYHFPVSQRSGIYIAPAYTITGRNTFQGFAYYAGFTYQL